MSKSKKMTCRGTLRQMFISPRPRAHTLPFTHCIRVYSIHFHTGKGGRIVQRERRLEGQQFTKLGRKIPTLLAVSLVYKLL